MTNEEIDWEHVAGQVIQENERLRRRLAFQYMSRPPIVDELRWWWEKCDRWLTSLGAERVAIYITVIGLVFQLLSSLFFDNEK